MSQHQFKVGSIVFLQSERGVSRQQGRYFVEAQMPPLGTALQYRIKSESEGFRRVVVEDQISSPDAEVTTAKAPAEMGLSGEED